MATDYASAVRSGTMAAGRLHRELGVRELVECHGGNVDVFGAISELGLPLMLRPLQGLLGAYLPTPVPGMLVTTERRMSIQRFTAAHELGHYAMRHQPSLDDESILRRMPTSPEPTGRFEETEADAFAVAFMMPKWLILAHAARQGWQVNDFRRSNIAYQLSLRLGASYEATCRTLQRYALIDDSTRVALLDTKPRPLKLDLLQDYRPDNYRGDVWLLTEKDAGTRIDASRDDAFVLRLHEHAGGGYVWDFDQLAASGFAIVRDRRENRDADGIGGPIVRRVTAAVGEAQFGRVTIAERRPWAPDPSFAVLALEFDVTGPEQKGLSRAERRLRFEEA